MKLNTVLTTIWAYERHVLLRGEVKECLMVVKISFGEQVSNIVVNPPKRLNIDYESLGLENIGSYKDVLARFQKLPFANGEVTLRGSETSLVFRAKEFVYKVYAILNPLHLECRLDKIRLFNTLFDWCLPYTVIGCMTDSEIGDLFLLARQKYVPFIKGLEESPQWKNTMTALTSLLKAHFDNVNVYDKTRYCEHWTVQHRSSKEWFTIEDIKPANVGINMKTNDVVIVDCLIYRNNPFAQLSSRVFATQARRTNASTDALWNTLKRSRQTGLPACSQS